jgi:hypothetical protein
MGYSLGETCYLIDIYYQRGPSFGPKDSVMLIDHRSFGLEMAYYVSSAACGSSRTAEPADLRSNKYTPFPLTENFLLLEISIQL